MAEKIKEAEQAKQSLQFSKEKICFMGRYSDRADLLSVLLNHEKSYTLKEVDQLIAEFMKGKVK